MAEGILNAGGANANQEDGNNVGGGLGGGFGSQQQFQLKAYYGEAARAKDEDEEGDEEKKDQPKKVRTDAGSINRL